MLTERQLRSYLERIGMDMVESSPNCTSELLDRLIHAHLLSVPFSTVDIVDAAVPPSLEVEALYDKIVQDHHGGYCFELNKLFEALLATLGFDVRPCLCRSVRGRDPMPVNHRGELVKIGSALHYADVGFGGPLSCKSIPLVDGEEIFDGMHTFIPVRMDENDWWRLDRYTGGESDIFGDIGAVRRQTELLICTLAADEAEFCSLNQKLSKPGVLFFDHDIANLRTEDGYIALMDLACTLRDRRGKQVIKLQDKDERDSFVEREMGLKTYR